MSRAALPWILLAVGALAWFLWGRGDDLAADIDREQDRVTQLEQRIANLQAQIRAERERKARDGAGKGAGGAPGLSTGAGLDAAEARARAEHAENQARTNLNLAALAIARKWNEEIRSLKTNQKRRGEVIADVRAALDDPEPARELAALRTLRWLANLDLDRADLRRAIEPHAASATPTIRRAALEALASIDPQPADLEPWLEEARQADRSNAEPTAVAIARVAKGRIEGVAAEAVLVLLRDGTRIDRGGVMRGLQGAQVFDPRVEARMIEIVRAAAPGSDESHYFYYFLAPRLDPKSDAVVDQMLEAAGGPNHGELGTILRGLRFGLSDEQRRRAADTLMTYAENADTPYVLSALVEALKLFATSRHVPRLEALLEEETVRKALGPSIKSAIESARNRD